MTHRNVSKVKHLDAVVVSFTIPALSLAGLVCYVSI